MARQQLVKRTHILAYNPQIESLMLYIMRKLPTIATQVFESMGVKSLEEFRSYMESLRKS